MAQAAAVYSRLRRAGKQFGGHSFPSGAEFRNQATHKTITQGTSFLGYEFRANARCLYFIGNKLSMYTRQAKQVEPPQVGACAWVELVALPLRGGGFP